MRRRIRAAERRFPGGELVEQRAKREQIAARIAAHAEHLLRRHVGPVADRDAQFLGKQIRVVPVARQAEVDDGGLAARAVHHVGRFEVEAHHVLAVDVMQRHGERVAELRCVSSAGTGARRIHSLSMRPSMYSITRYGVVSTSPERHQRRVMRALLERAEHDAADLEADHVGGAFTRAQALALHDERQGSVVARQAVDGGHGAEVDHLAQLEAVDLDPGSITFRAPGGARGARAILQRGSSAPRLRSRTARGKR